jgi:hypothetical protein
MGRRPDKHSSPPITVAPVFWAWLQQQAAPDKPLHLTRCRAIEMQLQVDADLPKAVHLLSFRVRAAIGTTLGQCPCVAKKRPSPTISALAAQAYASRLSRRWLNTMVGTFWGISMILAGQLVAIISLLGAIAWGVARWRHRSQQIREEQRRHWAVYERACAAKGLTIRA